MLANAPQPTELSHQHVVQLQSHHLREAGRTKQINLIFLIETALLSCCAGAFTYYVYCSYIHKLYEQLKGIDQLPLLVRLSPSIMSKLSNASNKIMFITYQVLT